jgi:hypothetical protein
MYIACFEQVSGPRAVPREGSMDEMQSVQGMRTSKGSIVAVMLCGVILVAGGASVAYGVQAGGIEKAAWQRCEILNQQAKELSASRHYDDAALKQQQCADALNSSRAYVKAEQTWTRIGAALIGISLVGLVFTWVRRRAKTRPEWVDS